MITQFYLAIGLHQNLLLGLAILLGAAVALSLILRLAIKRLIVQSQRSKNRIDDLLLPAVAMPLQLLLWLGWLYLSFALLATQPGWQWFRFLEVPLTFLPLLIIVLLLFRIIHAFENALTAENTETAQAVPLVARILKIIILIAALLSIAQYFGLSVASILTVGGMGGIIIGFAAKDMLANIFGGLMLQIDRPFTVGDWIRCSEYPFEGTVEKIGWRITKVRTFSRNPIYIPNSIFANIPIETPSRMSNRRIKETIGIRYDDLAKLDRILADVRHLLENHPEIDTDRILMVNFNHYNAYSVDFFIYTFTKTTRWQAFHEIKQDILLKIGEIIEKHGAQIAYPTQIEMVKKLDHA